MIKKIFKVLPFLLIAFILPVSMAKAGNPININGFAFSDNIGQLQFNTGFLNPVTISTSTANPAVANFNGYAWSDNIGWVSFNPTDLANCPNGSCAPTVNLSSGAVTGWARACAGTIKAGDSLTSPLLVGDCTSSASRTDGWDGWIHLSGTNHVSPTLNGTGGITFSSSTGSFNGYAWGSDIVGWLNFNSGADVPVSCNPDCGGLGGNTVPTCTISAVSPNSTQININYSISNDPNKTNYKLVRNSTTNILTGISTGPSSSYSSLTINDTGLSANTTYTYSISTSTIPLCTSVPVTTPIAVDCFAHPSDPSCISTAGKMWLNDNLTLTSIKIGVGKNVKVNWDVGVSKACSVNKIITGTGATDITNFSGTKISPTGNIMTGSLNKGKYDLGINCSPEDSPNRVQIIVTDSVIREN